MNRKFGITIVVLVFLGIFLFSVSNNTFVGNVIHDIFSDEGAYNYTGPDGKTYNFEKVKIGENMRHILSYRLAQSSTKGSFERIKIANIPFRYGPEELEDIPMDQVRREILFAETIYITRDKNLEGIEFSPAVTIPTLARVLDNTWADGSVNLLQIPTGLASTVAIEGEDLPVITCKQSNPERRVIEVRHGDENRIYLEDECIVMESKGYEDSMKVSTKLTYHVLGIM